MSEMVSRWPVVVSIAIGAADRDGDGRLTDAAIERCFTEARAAYFAECATVDEIGLEVLSSRVQRGDAPAGDGVTVSVSVVEVYPDSFTMNARLRPEDTDGIVATAWCSLSPSGEVTAAMRDEFIALAHSARHYH